MTTYSPEMRERALRMLAEAAEEIKRLEREVAELRRANEIMKSASVCFAKELDRPTTR